jgi:hypothetical protein
MFNVRFNVQYCTEYLITTIVEMILQNLEIKLFLFQYQQ